MLFNGGHLSGDGGVHRGTAAIAVADLLSHEYGVAHRDERLARRTDVLTERYDYGLRSRNRHWRAAARHILVPIGVDAAAKQLFHVFTSILNLLPADVQ